MQSLSNFDFEMVLQNAELRKKINSSVYPINCTIEQYLQVWEKIINKNLVENSKQIAEKIIDTQNKYPWLLFLGGVGRGKTINMHVLVSFIKSIYKIGIVFSSTTNLIQNDELAAKAKTCELLIIDDVGVESNLQKKYGNTVFTINEIIENRYNYNFPTYITTNLDGEKLKYHLGVRIIDRIRETCGIIKFDEYFKKSLRY